MAVSSEFGEFLKEQLEGFGPVEVKRMFGGAGLFRDGLMFGLISSDVLYFKVDDENTSAFDAEGLDHFTYTTKKGEKSLMSYRRAPERCLDDPDDMTEWAGPAFSAALRANTKKTSKKTSQKSTAKK